MLGGFDATIFRLWKKSPFWQWSAAGGVTFITLFAINVMLGPSSGGGPGHAGPSFPIPPPAPSASEARLAAYENVYVRVTKTPAAGERCEQLADAMVPLQPEDLKQGRDIRRSSKERIAALNEGKSCQADIAASDRHFQAVAQAVAVAQANQTPETVRGAADSLKKLDAFDQSRALFKTDAAVVDQAQGYARDLTEGDTRIDAMVNAAGVFQADRSAANAIAASQAVGHLSHFDRGRLSPSQQASAATADDATRLLRQSHARLTRVERLLAENQAAATPDAAGRLMDALTALKEPFDQDVASPDQQQRLAQARSLVLAGAWPIAQEQLARLDKDHSLAASESVANIYKILKDAPLAGLSAAQKQVLERAQAVSDEVEASNAHLQALLDADTQWRTQHLAAAQAVDNAIGGVKPFDQERFQDAEKRAWASLQKAATIIHGPEFGLNQKTKATMPIFVTSSAGLGDEANTLRLALKRSGFLIADDQRQAALTADVTAMKVSEPETDYGPDPYPPPDKVTADVNATFTWAADDSLFTTCQRPITALGRDKEGSLRLEAWQEAIEVVADCLETATKATQTATNLQAPEADRPK